MGFDRNEKVDGIEYKKNCCNIYLYEIIEK